LPKKSAGMLLNISFSRAIGATKGVAPLDV
jgi:hypothetical protein